jgi:hypothetical protein
LLVAAAHVMDAFHTRVSSIDEWAVTQPQVSAALPRLASEDLYQKIQAQSTRIEDSATHIARLGTC